MDTIFMESSETLGLLYDRYHKLPEIIGKFLTDIEDSVKNARKSGADKENKLVDKLDKFKKDVEINVKNPDPVHSDEIKSQRKKCQAIKDDTLKLLDRLGQIKKEAKFGDNFFNGILSKPKIFHNTEDDEENVTTSKFVREVTRCMDWVEKIILDLLNLTDQDLNILSLVQRVYYRKIFEFKEEDDDLMSINADMPVFESYLGYSDDDNDESYSLMNTSIKSDEFFPIFSIIVSYDKNKLPDNPDSEQISMTNMGSVIGKITAGDRYTHALMAFDTSFEKIYHFTGKGLIIDNITKAPIFDITSSIYVNVTFVTREEKDIIMNEVNQMLTNHPENNVYDVLQVVNLLAGKSKHADRRMVCSTFVGYILACGNLKNLHRDYSLIRPEDITILPRSFYVINFEDKNDFIKRKGEFERRVKQIHDDNIEEIKEYNNILPKIVINGKMKEAGTISKFFDWVVKKVCN